MNAYVVLSAECFKKHHDECSGSVQRGNPCGCACHQPGAVKDRPRPRLGDMLGAVGYSAVDKPPTPLYTIADECTDADLIRHALHLWANYIETGNVVLSANDAKASHQPFRALDADAMKLVVRLRELAEKPDL